MAAATVAAGGPPGLPRYNLRPGSPDVSAFPRQAWLAATRKALTAAPAEALGYCDPRGRPELRQALAGYLARARGVQVTPDRVVAAPATPRGWPCCARYCAPAGRRCSQWRRSARNPPERRRGQRPGRRPPAG